MNAKRDRGFHHAVGIDAIALERPAGVDDEIRLDRLQLRLDLALAIEHRRDRARGAAKRGAERFGLGARTTRDEECQPRLIGEELRQPAAEGAVTAEDEDAHSERVPISSHYSLRHGRACPGYPRLACSNQEKKDKTWMPAT
jgi:hypothetical protein